MIIYPAIDIIGGQAVRLYKGDYDRMTVYAPDAVSVSRDFARCGATHIHIVDLEGARDGGTPNLETVCSIKRETGLFCEIGGGIRSMATVERYLSKGIDRVILGTAAVRDEAFLNEALSLYGEQIAVGVDIRDGYVAIKGWLEATDLDAYEFCERMQQKGVRTIICTDISKDGAMQGTNRELYRELSTRFGMQIIASGGVSSTDDVQALKALNIHGAIIGKAYYTGAIDLKEALALAQ